MMEHDFSVVLLECMNIVISSYFVKCFTSHKCVMDDEWTCDIHRNFSKNLNNYFSSFTSKLKKKIRV